MLQPQCAEYWRDDADNTVPDFLRLTAPSARHWVRSARAYDCGLRPTRPQWKYSRNQVHIRLADTLDAHEIVS